MFQILFEHKNQETQVSFVIILFFNIFDTISIIIIYITFNGHEVYSILLQLQTQLKA